MLSLPMILFLAFALVVLGCIAFTLRHVASAPAGYEDENGFHALTPKTRPLLESDLVRSRDLATHDLAPVEELGFQR